MKRLLPLCLSLLLLASCTQRDLPALEKAPIPSPTENAAPDTPPPTPSPTPAPSPQPTWPALSDEELAAARQAAQEYYAGTVFTVHSLTLLSPPEASRRSEQGEVLFAAACSKGGQEQPERTIALERRDGVWTVVNEGY